VAFDRSDLSDTRNALKPFFARIFWILLSIAQTTLATDNINPTDASKQAGEGVVVEGVVASVHATPKGVAFLNLGEAYPHQVFSGFISNLSAVGDESWLNDLKGKTVRIHGRIKIYYTIHEIRVISKGQVRVE
jgi:hypothetical protein